MQANHFDYVPSTVERRRSVFKFEKACARSAYLGFLYPICKPVRVMPGSSISLNVAAEIRSGSLVAPLMDEMYCDIYSFFVPNRIVWEHWKQFIGAVDEVLFNNLQSYSIPSFRFGINSTALGTFYSSGYNALNASWNQLIACHYGLPYPITVSGGTPQVNNLVNCPKISALPFRGYTFIWSEFFRPEQLVSPQVFNKTDSGWVGMNMDGQGTNSPIYVGAVPFDIPEPTNVTGSSQSVAINGGAILKTYRAHKSLWTSCLPAPSLETLNLLANLEAPVGFVANASGTTSGAINPSLASGTSVSDGNFYKFSTNSGAGVSGLSSGIPIFADLSQAMLTVNNYRETIMLQNYYDVLNRAGSRYDEIIFNIFGVRAGNSVIDIPELITHKRFTIYRNQVIATANSQNGAGANEPIGTQGAYIDTIVKDSFFTRSFTEHGYVHLLYTIRSAKIRSSQGIEPEWQELDKFDLYYPQFDGMGDVPRNTRELFYDFTAADSTQTAVFGYQEYGAVWKYERDDVAGWVDPLTPNAIKGMTLAEAFVSAPVLSDDYISCLNEFVAFGNCLAISSPLLSPHFVIDWRLTGNIAHPMPVYNIPGQGALL